MDALMLGFTDALSPSAVLFVFLGVLLGYVIGVLPGLNRPAALAVAIPLSYYMGPVSAVGFLIGIAKASGAGGATTAILINVPGEPNAVATCIDGYPMARAGQGQKALKIALYSSVLGDIFGTVALIALAQPLAMLALHVGPVEMTGIMLISLTFIAALAEGSVFKSMAAGVGGILFATVGTDIETATPRLTFGQIELFDGVPLLAVTVGMLALSEMFIQIEELKKNSDQPQAVVNHEEDRRLRWGEFVRIAPTVGRSSVLGVLVGLLPGLGPTIASFASYALAKKIAGPDDKFGEGEPKGVAAAETADNAVVPASFIPLFALGIPGSVSAALLVGALTIHGVVPGPRMFETHARVVYGIYGAMLLASLLMLIVGRLGLVGFASLTRVPPTIIIPVVVALCIAGAYLESRSLFSVQLMVAFAVLGYVMHKRGYSRVTFLIGFIVGPLLELSLRQSIILLKGDVSSLLKYPVALALIVAAVGLFCLFVRASRKRS